MNCLLLLIVLLCCGGNGMGCSNGYTCNNVHRRDECGMRKECDRCSERREKEYGCNHDNHSCHTPPPMARTQFPYLDVEPRTCGCEEKSE